MITAIRRLVSVYFPFVGLLASILALSSLIPSAQAVPAIILAASAAAFALWLGSPAAAQRQACFDWQRELVQLRQEALQRENVYRELLDRLPARPA